MITSRSRSRKWLAVFAPLALGGCEVLGIGGEERFIITVDSIVAPTEVPTNTPITVGFFGGIGADGCSRLRNIDSHRTPESLDMQFNGVREGRSCTQMPAFLEHMTTLYPPFADSFVIRARQPRGRVLEHTVRIVSD